VPMSSAHSTIPEDVTAGDEPVVWTHEQRSDRSHFIRSSGVPGRSHQVIRRYPLTAWSGEFVLGKRVMMMPGLIALIHAPRLPQRTTYND
jgi:hypothetical protein